MVTAGDDLAVIVVGQAVTKTTLSSQVESITYLVNNVNIPNPHRKRVHGEAHHLLLLLRIHHLHEEANKQRSYATCSARRSSTSNHA